MIGRCTVIDRSFFCNHVSVLHLLIDEETHLFLLINVPIEKNPLLIMHTIPYVKKIIECHITSTTVLYWQYQNLSPQ